MYNKPGYYDIGKSSNTPSNPNAIYNNQQQYQIPPQQAQIIAEIRYTVYQDLQNLVNLLYSMSEVTRAFKNSADKTMVTISKNKIILQLNLSNTIHKDLEQRSQNDPILQSELIKTKEKAAQIAKQVNVDPQLQGFLNQYLNNNLNRKVQEQVLPIEKVDVQGNFNENVVQQIIQSIQTNDQQYEKIRQNPQQPLELTAQQVIQKAEQYKKLTGEKIAKNFPQLRR